MRVVRVLCVVWLCVAFVGCDAVSEPERFYAQSVVRVAADEFEEALIDEAESAYPPRDSVLAVASDPALIPATDYWFYTEYGGVRVPYALTTEAVVYYSGLIDALEAGQEPYDRIHQAELVYRARVRFRDSYTFTGPDTYTLEPLPAETFDSVYVAELRLQWYQICDDACQLFFEHTREVVFDENGTLLRVYFDGRRPGLDE